MQKVGNRLVFSASDLSKADECLWAQVRRIDRALGFDVEVPKDMDPMLVRAGSLGDRHELARLAEFRNKHGDDVVEIPRPDLDDSVRSIEDQLRELGEITLQALRGKKPVVFQATFFDGEFQGFADFLILTDDKTYAVYDSKLARKAKISALMQLAAYAHQLKQNGIPTSDQVHLLLGDDSVSSHDLKDILPTYLYRRSAMQGLIASRSQNKEQGGTPVTWGDLNYSACGKCVVCEAHVKANDDLLQIAGMRLDQRSKLISYGIRTATELGMTSVSKVEDLSRDTFAKLKAQAKIQHKSLQKDLGSPPEYEVFNPTALSAIPEPNPGDVFFDFEGDPLYREGRHWNLDYLFGYVDEKSNFTPIWAHSLEAEKAALIRFCKILRERLAQHPGMHVYHYASYEKTHLLSIAARHGVEEDFVDELLKKNILVDLYPILRRALLVGAESYSLKKIERIYFDENQRKGVSTAVDSVVEYANYCDLVANHQLQEAQEKLREIEIYNNDDCASTLQLRNWLVEEAHKHNVPLVGSGELDVSLNASDEDDPLAQKLNSLIADTPEHERTPDQTAIALAAAAIDFHRRENKSFWWAHFDRLNMPIDEWMSSKDIYLVSEVVPETDWRLPPDKPRAKNQIREIRVTATPSPGSHLKVGLKLYALFEPTCSHLPDSSSPGARKVREVTVEEVFDENTFTVSESEGNVKIQHDCKPVALTPGRPPGAENLHKAILSWAQKVLDNYPQMKPDPALDILRRVAPLDRDLSQVTPSNAAETVVSTLLEMETGTLAVQGPPGSGKSHNGGKVIAELVLKHGWKIGVVSQSHATVENLLRSVAKAGLPRELVGKKLQETQSLEEVASASSTTWTPIKKDGYGAFLSENLSCVVGGTIFDFTKPQHFDPKSLDLLVIDEAGQFSLANTIAGSTIAKRLLLLGDPQQLPQVSQGKHPVEVDGSALGWLAGDAKVLPAKFGYFLPSSWRMVKEVCQVVSDNYYESRLESSAPARHLEDTPAGFFPVPVSHQGNSTESLEEADRVVQLARDLVVRNWTDEHGTAPLSQVKENIIVVAPYNAQVQLIRRRLDAEGLGKIPVGTVDKFQGQEAAVAILSMTASSAEDVPRGIEFLLMPNRLNVAISRAKWASYLIYSPSLMDYKPTNLENLKLLSGFINLLNIGAS
jgi:predicted RecB family nuclease